MSNRALLAAAACAAVLSLPAIALAQTSTPPGELSINLNDLRLLNVDSGSGSETGAAIDASLLAVNRDLPVSARLDLNLLKAGDVEAADLEARLFHGGDHWSFGGVVGLRDIGSAPNVLSYGLEAEHYGEGFTLSGAAYRLEPSTGGGPDANQLQAGVTFYPTDNLSLKGRLVHVEPDGAASYDGYGVEVETRMNNRASLFASWDSSNDTDTDVIGVGIRFGSGESLEAQDRGRTGHGPDRLFRTPF